MIRTRLWRTCFFFFFWWNTLPVFQYLLIFSFPDPPSSWLQNSGPFLTLAKPINPSKSRQGSAGGEEVFKVSRLGLRVCHPTDAWNFLRKTAFCCPVTRSYWNWRNSGLFQYERRVNLLSSFEYVIWVWVWDHIERDMSRPNIVWKTSIAELKWRKCRFPLHSRQSAAYWIRWWAVISFSLCWGHILKFM